MKTSLKILSMLVVAAFTFLMYAAVEAHAATYYVSTSGSDHNDGLSPATPWKSLDKVSDTVFSAGDQILLKSGDTWEGEVLQLQGNGTQLNPIRLSSYGAGAKPIISPEMIDAIAIHLNGLEGWEIKGLQLQNAYEGIRLEYNYVSDKEYIVIEDMVIRNMNRLYNSNPEQYNHTSAGISVKTYAPGSLGWEDMVNVPGRLTALTQLIVKDIEFYDCDTGTWFGAAVTNSSGFMPAGHDHMWIKQVYMENLHIEHGGMWGFDFHFIDGGTFINLSTDTTGTLNNPFGSAAILIAYSKNAEFIGGEIAHAQRHPNQNYDGVGFDFEGVGKNVALRNMNIHHTDGAGIFHYNNSGLPYVDTVIDNNVVSHYGLNPGNSSQGIYFAGGEGIVTNNTFYNSTGKDIYGGSYSQFQFINNTEQVVSSSYNAAPPASLAAPVGTSLVTSTTTGTLRNDTIAKVGYQFTVGSQQLLVTGLGRKYVEGNIRPHTLYLYRASDQDQVGVCNVSSATAAIDAAGYQYCRLAVPTTLQANTDYYLLSIEDSGGDYWYDDTNTSLTLSNGVLNFSAYKDGASISDQLSNRAYGPLNLLYSAVPDVTWDFSIDGDVEGWTMANQVSGTVSAGSLHLTSSGVDPHILSEDNLNISNPETLRYVRLNLKNNTSSTKAKLYFTTTTDPVFSEDKSMTFNTAQNMSEYVEYTLDMGKVSKWSGVIKQLRFDPMEAPGTISIDYIAVISTDGGLGENFAIAGTASASSTDELNGYAVEKVNDNVSSTDFNGWASASPVMPQWVEIDFNTTRTFGRVDLYTTSGFELRGYHIQYWNGTAWVECMTPVTGNSSAVRIHTFDGVTSSKLRISVTDGDLASSYARINEIRVFAN